MKERHSEWRIFLNKCWQIIIVFTNHHNKTHKINVTLYKLVHKSILYEYKKLIGIAKDIHETQIAKTDITNQPHEVVEIRRKKLLVNFS